MSVRRGEIYEGRPHTLENISSSRSLSVFSRSVGPFASFAVRTTAGACDTSKEGRRQRRQI